ncbi:hypothetical protein K501DRAFT_196848 [Backusella circina FSU 941]|nr:hypothetical protein K501DRAFT_196848 [Backusella circina FSU 941]
MVVRFMSTLSVLSVPLGLLAKALLTVSSYKTALGTQADKVPFLQGFTSCVLLASAGTNTVAILRGESIGVLKNTPFWLTFGVVYTLIFYSKTISDAIQKAMTSPLFKAVFLALVCMDRGDTMIRYGVDGVTSIIGTDKLIAKLVCGTLAGCAGDLWSGKLDWGNDGNYINFFFF